MPKWVFFPRDKCIPIPGTAPKTEAIPDGEITQFERNSWSNSMEKSFQILKYLLCGSWEKKIADFWSSYIHFGNSESETELSGISFEKKQRSLVS